MKDNGTKNIIAAIILGASIVLATYIYAQTTRYEMHSKYPYIVLDKWTGKQVINKH